MIKNFFLKTVSLLLLAGSANAETLTPEQFGAVANDNLNDQSAIQAAINALQPNDTLVFGPGQYIHNNTLVVTKQNVDIEGRGTSLVSTNQALASLIIQDSTDVSVQGIDFVGSGTARSKSDRSCAILTYRSSDVTILGNMVSGFAGCGIMVQTTSDFTVWGNLVHDTFADGIHVTNTSNHGSLLNNITWDTGDDGLALVGYRKQAGPVTDMVIAGNSVLNEAHPNLPGAPAYHGNGIRVEGATNVVVDNNYIQNTASSGLNISSAGPESYDTFGADNVTVTRNTVINANQSCFDMLDPTCARVVHGGILLSAYSGSPITNIVLQGNTIQDTVGATAHIRVNPSCSGIQILDNNIVDEDSSHLPWIFYRGSQVTQSGNTYNSALLP